jgi:hypothetical protein
MQTDRRNILRLFAGVGALGVAGNVAASVNVAHKPPAPSRLVDFLGPRRPRFMPEMDPAWLEIRDHMLYDRIVFPAGTPIPNYLPFYVEPIGCCKPGTFHFKTYLDTNNMRGCQLPPPMVMLVKQVVVFCNPDAAPADLARFFKGFYFEFRLDDKVYARAPLLRRPVLGSLDQMVSIEDVPRHNRTSRRPVSLARDIVTELEEAIFIAPMQQFTFTLHGPLSGYSDRLDPVAKELIVSVGLDGEMGFSRQ